jgi:predicted nucleotidyltransferase
LPVAPPLPLETAEFDERSDLDFLVSFDPEADVDLFEMGGLQYELEELMGRKVDLVEKEALRNPYRKQHILQHRQIIYAG